MLSDANLNARFLCNHIMNNSDLSYKNVVNRIRYTLRYINEHLTNAYELHKCNDMARILKYFVDNGHLGEEEYCELEGIIDDNRNLTKEDIAADNEMMEFDDFPNMKGTYISPESCLNVFTEGLKELVGDDAYEHLMNDKYDDKYAKSFILDNIDTRIYFDDRNSSLDYLKRKRIDLKGTLDCMRSSIACINNVVIANINSMLSDNDYIMVRFAYDNITKYMDDITLRFDLNGYISYECTMAFIFETIRHTLKYDLDDYARLDESTREKIESLL